MSAEPKTEDLLRYFKKDIFVQHVGIELLDVGAGRARACMPVQDYHFNGVRIVHGGALFTLADLAFAAAANSRGRVAVAINCTISYVRSASGKVLYAEAREVAANHKIASYTVEISDDSGEIVAVFQGTAYRKKDATAAIDSY